MDLINEIKYISLQISYIFSIIFCIFTLFHLLSNSNLRSTLHNHVPLILLLISLFDLCFNHPFTLNYLRTGHVQPSTNILCLFWNFINSTLTISTYLTMSWASIERHIFIFHSQIFTHRFHRLLFHYFPLFLFAFLYPILFNFFITFVYPCENHFNMFALFCAYPCALKVPSLALYARIAHNFLPTFVVVTFTISLLLRVILQKRQVQQNLFRWRKCRQMILQLMSIAILFLVLTLPTTLVSIVQNCCLSTFAAAIQVNYLNFMVRFLNILMPFVCLSLLPEIWSKLLFWKRQRIQIVPIRTRTNNT
ncbi:unnamed protein product [Adineta ricciae]|uniref:G-protein coupled receptors family 1 profile domain-containing protein n=1 Tax=Adineta ricciae TaxID=249248 RepID=A0A814EU05_ADIRI|nr:unnamed protein product [Adineta ricciae]CAF1195382.1 unnamed protein product [Adineta ricciae]